MDVVSGYGTNQRSATAWVYVQGHEAQHDTSTYFIYFIHFFKLFLFSLLFMVKDSYNSSHHRVICHHKCFP